MARFPVTRILYSCLSFACFLCLSVSSMAQADKAPLPIVTGDGETTTLDGLLVKYTVQVDDGPTMGKTAQFFDDQLNMVVVVYELPDRPETGIDENGRAERYERLVLNSIIAMLADRESPIQPDHTRR
jgi:hypothetical protein